MDPFTRLRALTQYPDWHRKPLRLSRAEMDDPYLVLEEFFNLYNLHNLRVCLRQWLRDVLYSEREEVTDHFDTCEHMEKLAEAAWQLWRRKEAAEGVGGGNNEGDGTGEGQEPEAEEGGAERKCFAKRWMLDGGRCNPTAFIRKVFRTVSPGSLQEVLTEWRTRAFSSETGCYEEASERKDLLAFTDELCRLTEACFALGRIAFWKECSGIDINRAAGLQPDLLQEAHNFHLTR